MPGPNAAYHSGIDCLRPDGAYTTDPNRHWKGTVTVAKHKCEEDPQCTTLYHDGDSGYGDTHVNWRACKSVNRAELMTLRGRWGSVLYVSAIF